MRCMFQKLQLLQNVGCLPTGVEKEEILEIKERRKSKVRHAELGSSRVGVSGDQKTIHMSSNILEQGEQNKRKLGGENGSPPKRIVGRENR